MNHLISRKQGQLLDNMSIPERDSEVRLVIQEGGKPMKGKLSGADSDARSEAGSIISATSSKKNIRIWMGISGDVTRKGKVEPYAYWPLDQMMTSRGPEHRAAARKGMVSVVELTKNWKERVPQVHFQ